MKNISVWKTTSKTNSNNKKMENNIKCDVLIIGGGITGLSTALYLDESGKKVILIDKSNIGNGVTANSTGKLTIMQDVIYSKIEKATNFNTALNYYKSQKCALKLIDSIIKKYNIDCDYKKSSSITFVDDIKGILNLEHEEKFYQKAKIKYKKIQKLDNGYPITYGLQIDNMHVFNPLKFILEIKQKLKNVEIYEHVNAESIKKSCNLYKIKTNKGIIFAKKIVVATHYPFFIKPGFIPFRTHIEKSYLLAAKVNKIYDFNAINCGEKVTSMRYYQDFLVMSNNSHVTTDKDNYNKNFQDSCNKFIKNFKGQIEYIWSNHDVITNDNMPYIGNVDRNLFIATGYNKWGLLNGVLAGKIISDSVLNKKNHYKNLFSLTRNGNLVKFVSSIKSNTETAKTYIKMHLTKPNKYKLIYSTKNNKDIVTYKQGKKEYSVYNKCPHMGCKLLFNEKEKTWDCPCHGSRFDLKGKCIFGPSTYSISIDEKTK